MWAARLYLNDPDQYPLIVRPVDKQENYIKRCVGMAGDTLQIKNQIVFINGRETKLPIIQKQIILSLPGDNNWMKR